MNVGDYYIKWGNERNGERKERDKQNCQAKWIESGMAKNWWEWIWPQDVIIYPGVAICNINEITWD